MNPDKDRLAEDAITKADEAIELLMLNAIGLKVRFGPDYAAIAAAKVVAAIDAIAAYRIYRDPSAHPFW